MAVCIQQYLAMSRAKGAEAPSVDVWGGGVILADEEEEEEEEEEEDG